MDLAKVTKLTEVKTSVDEMLGFNKIATKKTSTPKGYEEAVCKLSALGIKLPLEYQKKYRECKYLGFVAQDDLVSAVACLKEHSDLPPDVAAEQSGHMLHGSILGRLAKCKPRKEPSSKEIQALTKETDNIEKALRLECEGKPDSALLQPLKDTLSQLPHCSLWVAAVSPMLYVTVSTAHQTIQPIAYSHVGRTHLYFWMG